MARRAGQLIDRATLRKLWCEGVPSKDIAARLGCSYPTVNRIAEDMGLPKRKARSLTLVDHRPACDAAQPASAARLVAETVAVDPVEAAILSARGYADLAAIAKDHGLALSEVQRRFHKVRR